MSFYFEFSEIIMSTGRFPFQEDHEKGKGKFTKRLYQHND